MLEYVVKRVLMGAVTLLVILFCSYVLMRLAPGDPAKSSVFGTESGGTGMMNTDTQSFERSRVMEEKLNFDKPLPIGFCLWLKDALRGDFGESVAFDKGQPVTALIFERMPVTIKLNIWAILLTYLLAIPLGIQAAKYADKAQDKAITVALLVLYALPVLFTALVLRALFCKGGLYPLFPLTGLTPQIADGDSSWVILGKTALHYVLPVLCLSYGSFAAIARYTRSGMLDVIRQDFIRTARAKGVSENEVILHHAFRNTLILMITLFAGILPALVGGSILIEYIFDIPGMGTLTMTALNSRDLPLMMGLFSFSGVLTLTGILIADILYVVADPRISFQGRNV